MRKVNASLKFAAQAVTAQRLAANAKSKAVKAYYTRKAARCLQLAASAKDVQAGIRFIKASNTGRSLRASLDEELEEDVLVDTDEVDELDELLVAEAEDTEEAEDEKEVDADDDEDEDDDDEDTEEEDEDEKAPSEVESRLASILASNRKRHLARLKAGAVRKAAKA